MSGVDDGLLAAAPRPARARLTTNSFEDWRDDVRRAAIDAVRTELVAGQFTDLVNDAGEKPTLGDVLDLARRRSGDYIMRRHLEIGGALAGRLEPTLRLLGCYGSSVRRSSCATIFSAPSTTPCEPGLVNMAAVGTRRAA